MSIHLAVTGLLQGFGIIAIVAVLYDLVLKQSDRPRFRLAGTAIVFAVGVALTMALPVEAAPGLVFDMRSVFLMLAASYGGLPAMLAAAAAAASMRIAEGGIGLIPGLISIVIAAGFGWIFAKYSRYPVTSRRGVAMLMMAAPLPMASLFYLPLDVARSLIVDLVVPVSLANMAGIIVVTEILNHKGIRIRRERELSQQASTDELTGIAARRELNNRGHQIAQRAAETGTPFTVLMIDMDHFKQINDFYGHHAGDEVLRTVAEAISSTLRSRDLVARYGGEEIVAILPGQDMTNGLRVANRLLETIRGQDYPQFTPPLNITASIGLYTCTDGQLPFERALVYADQAMYAAKAAGRDRIVSHDQPEVILRETAEAATPPMKLAG